MDHVDEAVREAAYAFGKDDFRAAPALTDIQRAELEAKKHDRKERAKDSALDRTERKRQSTSLLKRDETQHDQYLLERKCLFFGGIIVFASVLIASFCILANSTDAELRGWAKLTINTILTGFAAYFFRRPQVPEVTPRIAVKKKKGTTE